jgi:hypothetical protein
MDWGTAFATAGISALVSVVVSLLSVATVTVRQERAKRREQARLALEAAVVPLRDRLARYRYTVARETAARQPEGPAHLSDLEDLITVWRATSGLPAWRRFLVERRLRKIYGNGMVDLVRDYPTAPSESASNASLTAFFASSVSGVEPKDQPTASLIHRTYSQPPSAGRGKPLTRHLSLLARAR